MATFTLDLSRFADKTRADFETVVRKATFGIFRDVILGTPVQYGTARGNWNAAVGAPNVSWSEAKKDPSGAAAIAAAATVAAQYKLGSNLFLTNTVPYIIPLENGHSQQAPSGMVKITIRRWQRYVSAATRNV